MTDSSHKYENVNNNLEETNSSEIEIDSDIEAMLRNRTPPPKSKPKAVKLIIERFPQGRFHLVIHLLKTRLFAFYVNRLRGVYECARRDDGAGASADGQE